MLGALATVAFKEFGIAGGGAATVAAVVVAACAIAHSDCATSQHGSLVGFNDVHGYLQRQHGGCW